MSNTSLKQFLTLDSKWHTVRIGFTEENPYAFSCIVFNASQCSNIGIDLEYIYNVITVMFQLKVSWSYYNDFNDLHRALDSDEIDLMGNTRSLGLTVDKNESWYQTFPTQSLLFGFFVKSHIVPETLNPLSKMTWNLWLSILLITFMVSLLRTIAGKSLALSGLTLKFFYFFWFLILNIIMELYSNMLTNDLLIREKSPPLFTDLNDLGQKLIDKECQLAIFEKYNHLEDFDYILKPKHNLSWAANFRQIYTINPPILLQNQIDLLAAVRNGTCVIGIDYVSVDLSPYHAFCDIEIKIFPDEIPTQQFGYYHRIEALQRQMDITIASDSLMELPMLLLKRYLNSFIKDLYVDCKNSITQFEITLQQIIYCFVLLIGGIGLSSVIWIFQNIKYISSIYMTNISSLIGLLELSTN